MATPTDQQQIRATLRRAGRNVGLDAAASMMFEQACDVLGLPPVVQALANKGWRFHTGEPSLPALMGTAEVAEAFGIKNSNIGKLAPGVRPEPVARISNGTVPVYLASDVLAKAAKRRGSV